MEPESTALPIKLQTIMASRLRLERRIREPKSLVLPITPTGINYAFYNVLLFGHEVSLLHPSPYYAIF